MRRHEDLLGSVEVPDEAYYGVHAERARQNFDVSGTVIADYPHYVAAIATVKKACALANADIGVISRATAEAICAAADEVITGRFDRTQFPVDVFSGGGGVSANMAVNEVIANRANEIISGEKGYRFVHPNNHVNAGQSTSDAIATATNLALHADLLRLIESVTLLERTLETKIDEYRDAVKLSRTCLQDAVPVTFAQEFGAYLAVAQRGRERLVEAADACLDVPMGGTVVGTGLGVGAGYVERIYPRLREVTGLPIRRHPNFFDCYQNGDTFQHISTTLKALATNLAKMCRDLRILCSGNRTGMMEITLPAVQAGSSFMPGKVNPVMPELMVQIAYQVCGNDTTITMAVEGAELDFNAWTGVIAKNLFESCRLLASGIPLFATKCLAGLQVRAEHCQQTAGNTLALSSVVAAIYGYEAGSKAAAYASLHNTSIRQAVVELGIASGEVADELLNPAMITDASQSAAVLDRLVARERSRTEAVISVIPPPARQCVLDTAVRMAHADGRVSEPEARALHVIATALHLDRSEHDIEERLAAGNGQLSIPAGLGTGDKELVYACALWLAQADSVEEVGETELLRELADRLDLPSSRTAELAMQVDRLRSDRRKFVPRSEELPWWEEFQQVVVQVVGQVAAPA